jgi:hypothetical protein
MQCTCAVLYWHLCPVMDLPYFSMLSHKLRDFRAIELFKIKCVFWFSTQFWSETFSIRRSIQRNIITNVRTYVRRHVKYPLFLSDFNQAWIFSTYFRKKNPQISNFMKIRPVGAELFHADRETDRQTDMTKLIVAFCTLPSVFWSTVFYLICKWPPMFHAGLATL